MAEPAPAAAAPAAGRGGPWPASAAFGPAGLSVGGLAATSIAEAVGTPTIVVDEDDLRRRMRSVRAAYPRVAYAVKALSAHAVIRAALEEGLDLLCASGGELEACLRAGAPPHRIVLHGNAKTEEELRLAVEARVGLVIADHAEELRRLDAVARAAGREQPVLVRVIPEVEVRTHEAIATGHERSKFGTPLAEAVATAALAAELPGLRLDGLHAHAGSQLLDPAPYLRLVDTLLDLAGAVRDATGVEARVLDVGGGFGVTYVDEPALDPAAIAPALLGRADTGARRVGIAVPTLVVEPGRALVANPALTLYRVVARKAVAGRTLVAVDGGMSDNLRPMLYGARYAVARAARAAADARRDGEADRVTIVGRHCESGDVLADDVALPADIGPGDLVAVAATGAYGYALASAYNRIGRPAVVAVRGGAISPWLRREDAADLDRLEVGPASSPADRVRAPAGIEIRPARPRDARSYLDAWRAVVAEGRWVRTETVEGTVGAYRRRFRRSWSTEGADLVALDGSRVVGHVSLTRERHPATRHVATLGIAVAADVRGRGVGSALMAEAIRWARAVGVRKIVLSVYPGNAAAVALYRRFGFLEEGRLSRQSRKSYGYEDEILMARWVGDEG
jgi:diaminopimelate decarboxylase